MPVQNKELKECKLSDSQLGIWLLENINQDRLYAYLNFRLTGNLDVKVFKHSITALIKQYEILRTSICLSGNGPVQIINEDVEADWECIDLSASVDKEILLDGIIARELNTHIDLNNPSLARFKLVILSAVEHVCLIKMSHMITDFYSNRIFFKELIRVYNGLLKTGILDKKPVIQYCDFMNTQAVNASEKSEIETYWKKEFKDDFTPLSLAGNMPDTGSASGTGRQEKHEIVRILDTNRTKKIRAICFKNRILLSSFLLAVYYKLMEVFTREKDLIIGIVLSNRNLKNENEANLLGTFIDTFPLRIQIPGDIMAIDFIKGINAKLLKLYQYKSYPFQKVLEIDEVRKTIGKNNHIKYIFDKKPIMESGGNIESFSGLEYEIFPDQMTTTLYDMIFYVEEYKEKLILKIDYNLAKFSGQFMNLFIQLYENILSEALAGPEKQIKSLSLLKAEERDMILHDFNNTQAPYSADKCIHQLFEAQAARSPGNLACLTGEQSLTYEQLNHKANRLARLLRDKGVENGEYIAVFMERSCEMVVALLAVLKAGGCYIPVDTTYPSERVKYILACTHTRWIITANEGLGKIETVLSGLPDLSHIVHFDGTGVPAAGVNPNRNIQMHDVCHLDQYPCSDLSLSIDNNQLAYVIFTSGSTGEPKGVMVRHKPVINLIEWVNNTFSIGKGDKLLFITSICFDLSVYDIFGILAAGGTIRIACRETLNDPARLLDIIDREEITFWDSAPAAFQQLEHYLKNRAPNTGLRLVFLSGDWIPVRLPDVIRKSFTRALVISLGGATEATVWSNYYPVTEVKENWHSIPYGKPIQNAKYYILDSRGTCCPIGVPGDLYIGGECLASGYINSPGLTAEKFIKHEYADGNVIYKTGDKARWLADGNMEFLGRVDQQVKIRGYRIEVGEIESLLLKHDKIRAAVVIAGEAENGDKYLCAYYVSGQELSVSELRGHLSKNLPEYMIPSYFMKLDKIPMTPNGKIDKKSFPGIGKKINTGTEYVAPGNEIEEKLCKIWQEVLKIDKAGINDNFFALGGHSLLAIQVIIQIKQVLGCELPLQVLFTKPAIADLALSLEMASQTSLPILSISLDTISQDDSLSFPFDQQQVWFKSRLASGNKSFNLPIVVRLTGSLNQEVLKQSFKEIIGHYRRIGNNTVSTETIPLNVIDLRALSNREQEMQKLYLEEALCPFETDDPILRIKLFLEEENTRVLMFMIHPGFYDGLSSGIVMRRLISVYLTLLQEDSCREESSSARI